MKLWKVAKTSEFSELKPVFVTAGDSVIGVYRFRGRYFAYANQCPHQAGPACEGIVIGNQEAEILGGGRVREYTSSENMNIACPWHAVEFDLVTGICRADPRYQLRSYETLVNDDEVFIRA